MMLIFRDVRGKCDILLNMGLPQEKRRYTIAEYRALEEKAEERHEFHDGEILAMSGASRVHSRITANFLTALERRLADKPCQTFDAQLKVRIASEAKYVYPDISVVCGEVEADIDDPVNSITNPRLIVEVLSDSTESYDRGEKFDLYRKLPSLKEYVLVSQRQTRVEAYYRQDDDTWRFIAAFGAEASVTLASLQLQIPLSEIYARLMFPSAK